MCQDLSFWFIMLLISIRPFPRISVGAHAPGSQLRLDQLGPQDTILGRVPKLSPCSLNICA